MNIVPKYDNGIVVQNLLQVIEEDKIAISKMYAEDPLISGKESKPPKSLWCVKTDKNEGKKYLVFIPKDEVTWINIIKSWFKCGPLANVTYKMSDVCKYLGDYNFKDLRDHTDVKEKDIYQQVCEFAAKALEVRYSKPVLKPNDVKSAEIALWVKLSDPVFSTYEHEGVGKDYKVYLNNQATLKHVLIMNKLWDLHRGRDQTAILGVKDAEKREKEVEKEEERITFKEADYNIPAHSLFDLKDVYPLSEKKWKDLTKES